MSESALIWVEILFNLSYLVFIWTLVFLMATRMGRVAPEERPQALRITIAFGLLALGDTGHVGFRVLAYMNGGLQANPALVGMGALATAYTVTIFYMLLLDVWRLRYKKPLGWFGYSLLAAGVLRLVVMLFPQNEWSQVLAPYAWSLFRNAFLVYQGLGVMFLILRDARRSGDKPFIQIGALIGVSYACYLPVILWVAQVPLLGMLMIPKTLAYVAVAVVAYRSMWRQEQQSQAVLA